MSKSVHSKLDSVPKLEQIRIRNSGRIENFLFIAQLLLFRVLPFVRRSYRQGCYNHGFRHAFSWRGYGEICNPKFLKVIWFYSFLFQSSFTMSFVLYHLAKSPSKQKILFDELKTILPHHNSPINEGVLAKLKYLKAVVKESMRLNPISIGVGRILPEDGSFSGYHCPKNVRLKSIML